MHHQLNNDEKIYGPIILSCPACAGADLWIWRRKSYNFTQSSHVHEFSIHKCRTCGTGFINPPPSAELLNRIYAVSGQALLAPITLTEVLEQESRFANTTLDAEKLAKIAHSHNQTNCMAALDIGCGFGFSTKSLRQLGYETVSINPGALENSVFAEMNGDMPFIGMLSDYQSEKKFGVVNMSHVLEHMLNPLENLMNINGLMEKGGVLAISVPNFQSFLVLLLNTRENGCLWVPEHVTYFTATGLKKLLKRSGFNIICMDNVTRIRPDALSRRLGLQGSLARIMNAAVKHGQKPLARLANMAGKGIHLHVFAQKI